MDLTPENKAQIDAKDYRALLEHWRNAPGGDPWFLGQTGYYWGKRMSELRAADAAGAVRASKSIGWGGR